MKKLESLYMAGRNVNDIVTMENSIVFHTQKIIHRITI